MAVDQLPLTPLWRAYRNRGEHPLPLAGRQHAIRHAHTRLVNEVFVDDADHDTFIEVIEEFYRDVVITPIHVSTLRARSRLVRHALQHWLRGNGSLGSKWDACLNPDGAYHVPGLGRSFWSALIKAIDPDHHPDWLPTTELGLIRLGLMRPRPGDRPGDGLAQAIQAYRSLREFDPDVTAMEFDHFLALVVEMQGRRLPTSVTQVGSVWHHATDLARSQRVREGLRQQIKGWNHTIATAREQFAAALACVDLASMRDALAVVEPAVARRRPFTEPIEVDLRLVAWLTNLWSESDPETALTGWFGSEMASRFGPWLPAVVLYLREPARFPLWQRDTAMGFAALDDGFDLSLPGEVAYGLFREGIMEFRERLRLHPCEVGPILRQLGTVESGANPSSRAAADEDSFQGFSPDSFAFVRELAANNRREWMSVERERYRFVIREPLVELCHALSSRYVGPVLRDRFGWELETEARTGKALSSICKNDYGRSQPYQPTQWITFYRRASGAKREDAQFFVALSEDGLRFGLRLGRSAREASRRLRRNVQEHADTLFRAIEARAAPSHIAFCGGEDGREIVLRLPADLRTWVAEKTFRAECYLPPDSPLLWTDELVGEILLAFDRLVPIFVCAVEDDPRDPLAKLTGPDPHLSPELFQQKTFLGSGWLGRAMELLRLKRQLILQGVPGTGKTHVVRALAEVLVDGREDHVRLVQFHPSFSYEEFVEGIRPRSVEVGGRSEMSYPVEAGLLTEFANMASRHPAEPFVLIIDEINRGNLPRIFGELLYLLEYRDQAIQLPYSRRPFRLPTNLYLLGTMNAADRSITPVDAALRRRFSFLDMPPDARVLASWLEANPSPESEELGPRIVSLFEELNARLSDEFGSEQQIGHSFFMVPGLTESRLAAVWDHHVRPALQARGAVGTRYELSNLLSKVSGNRRSSPRV